MFETHLKDRNGAPLSPSGTIYKNDGRERFVEIAQAFGIGKVKLAFRTYNSKAQTGNKITQSIDCYLNIDEFGLLCHIITSGSARQRAMMNEKARSTGGYKYAKPIFEVYNGTTKNNQVISRHLTLSMKNREDNPALFEKMPFTLMVEEGPGIKTPTGAITPDKNGRKNYLAIGLSYDELLKLGINGQRAINIYDRWVADGTITQHLNEISYNKDRITERNDYIQQPIAQQRGDDYMVGSNYANNNNRQNYIRMPAQQASQGYIRRS